MVCESVIDDLGRYVELCVLWGTDSTGGLVELETQKGKQNKLLQCIY